MISRSRMRTRFRYFRICSQSVNYLIDWIFGHVCVVVVVCVFCELVALF